MFAQIIFSSYFSVLERDTGIERTKMKDNQQNFIYEMHFPVTEMPCVAALAEGKNGKRPISAKFTLYTYYLIFFSLLHLLQCKNFP